MTGNRHMHRQSLIDPNLQLEEIIEEAKKEKEEKPPEPSESSEDSFEMRR